MRPRARIIAVVILVALAGNVSTGAAENPDQKIKWGGRLQLDWATMSGDTPYQPFLNDGTEVRRARLFASGTLHEYVKFKVQLEFADAGNMTDEEVTKKDVYIELVKIPVVGTIRIGHMKEPFSLEELTSSKFLTFMERSVGNVFSPDRNTGILFYHDQWDGRLVWDFGIFADTDDTGSGSGKSSNYTARVSGLPWYQDESRFLHLGLGVTRRNPEFGEVVFSTEPEANLADNPITTGILTGVDEYLAYDIEVAWNRGPLSFQGEYLRADLDDGMSDPTFNAWYIQGSYFLTGGDHRAYDKSYGTFDRVRPTTPFHIENGGLGAWEVAARYSMLDLTENPVQGILGPGPTAQVGGEISDITLAVNWHLNDATRFSLNYVLSEVEDGVTGLTNDANILQARFQVDF